MKEKKKIKILYLIDKMHTAGAQIHLLNLITNLNQNMFEPFVCCIVRGGETAEKLNKKGVEVKVLNAGNIYSGKFWKEILGTLPSYIKGKKIDIVHTYLPTANVFGTLAACLSKDVKIITTRRDMGFSRSASLFLIEKFLTNKLAHKIISNANAISKKVIEKENAQPEKLVTIFNGIDTEKFAPRRKDLSLKEELDINLKNKVISVVAHMNARVKGHAFILRGMKILSEKVKNVTLLLVGDGIFRSEYENLARELGIADRCVFTGVFDDMPRIYSITDLLVVPSSTEGLSNVILEAMAMEIPVVATDVGGNKELIENLTTGLLVTYGKSGEVVRGIKYLLKNVEHVKKMKHAGRKKVLSKFTLKKMVRNTERVYRYLIN